MRTKSLMIACAVCAVLAGPAGHSANLMQVYEQATRNDPFIQEAEQRRLAALEAKPQARGALFPQIGAAGSVETIERDGSATFLQAVPGAPGRGRSSPASPPPTTRGATVCGWRSSCWVTLSWCSPWPARSGAAKW